MGNCFNKHGGANGLEKKSAKYQIQGGIDESLFEDEAMKDPEMLALISPMPIKPVQNPLKEDGIPYSIWKMNCMKQLKEEMEAMYQVIDRKVGFFEKRLKIECTRTDDDKLLKYHFSDYQDCLKLSKERLMTLLARDLKRHEDCIDELRYKKEAWENELQRSITKYRAKMDFSQIPEVLSSTGTLNVRSSQVTDGPFKKTGLFGAKKQSEDLQRFEWPSTEELKKMSLDQTTEYKVQKIAFKESFGCLKAI